MSAPVFIADSCIGGLSVVRSMWASGSANRAVFRADYAINPLGLKSDAAIATVARQWLELADACADTLVMACNTLSVRYHQLVQSGVSFSSRVRIVSMVDCFKALLLAESERLADRRVLVIGTEFTASQDVYPGLLRRLVPGASVATAPATELERRIARFLSWRCDDETVINPQLRGAINAADIVILACTCFPMAAEKLSLAFPAVTFLDPASYCAGLVDDQPSEADRRLDIQVSGDAISSEQVLSFAQTYLAEGKISADHV